MCEKNVCPFMSGPIIMKASGIVMLEKFPCIRKDCQVWQVDRQMPERGWCGLMDQEGFKFATVRG